MVLKDVQPLTQEQLAAIKHKLHAYWGWVVALGVALVILGSLALLSLVTTTYATIFFLGGVILGAGILQIIQGFFVHRAKSFFLHLLLGILSLAVAFLMLTHPTTTAVSLTLLLSAYFIVSGAAKIIFSLAAELPHWGWVLFNGIVTLLLGIMIMLQWPAASFWVIGLFIGIDLIFAGWSHIFLGLTARTLR